MPCISLVRVTSVAPETLRRTPLHERHRAAGAKLVPFAGWEMPLQYDGIQAEHVAVRRHAGVFDVSHMGQIETRGPGAPALLQLLLSNDIRRLPEGGAQYGVICNESGGVLDDLFTYRLAECHFLTVTNAANHERDLAWFQSHAGDFDVDVIDRLADYAMLAVQGPQARAVLSGLADGPLPTRMHCCSAPGRRPDARLRDRLHRRGRRRAAARPRQCPRRLGRAGGAGAAPAGLGARDTLRLEVCFHLYGNDLSEDRGPIEAGLGWCCREPTGFIGSTSVARVRAEGPAEKLVAFAIEGPGIARQGNPIAGGGVVTSGSFSPCLRAGDRNGLRAPERAEPGTRARNRRARHDPYRDVQPKPIYPRSPEPWPIPAIPMTCSITLSTTGRGSMVIRPRSASPGMRRTRWVRWCSSTRLRSAPRSPRTRRIPRWSRSRRSRMSSRPLSGEVVAVNDVLADKPETINEDPYGEGWLVKVKLSDPSEQDALLDCRGL